MARLPTLSRSGAATCDLLPDRPPNPEALQPHKPRQRLTKEATRKFATLAWRRRGRGPLRLGISIDLLRQPQKLPVILRQSLVMGLDSASDLF